MSFKKGSYLSLKTKSKERYDSSYEEIRMKTLDADDSVKHWTKNHGIKIRYTEGKKSRNYIPDFLIELTNGYFILEEVKGFIFNKMNFAKKNFAALSWCSIYGIEFKILFKNELDKFLYGAKANEESFKKSKWRRGNNRRNSRGISGIRTKIARRKQRWKKHWEKKIA